MGKQVCSICKKKLLANSDNFASRLKNGTAVFQGICRKCQSIYRKNHYQKNKQKYIDKASKWKDAERVKFFEYLKTKQCVDCGEKDPVVLEFDHKRDKKFHVSKMVGVVLFKVLLKEINKCEVVCANCHKRRTAKQFNWFKSGIRINDGAPDFQSGTESV